MFTAPEDGRNYRPKHVELIETINKIIIVASSWLLILLYTFINIKMSMNINNDLYAYIYIYIYIYNLLMPLESSENKLFEALRSITLNSDVFTPRNSNASTLQAL